MKALLKLTITVLAILSLVQCKTLSTEPYYEFSKGRMAAEFRDGAHYNVGDSIGLLDLSQGVTSRLWSFDTEDVSFVKGDATSDYIKVAFSEHGRKNIKLNCEFLDPEYLFEETAFIYILKDVETDLIINKITDFTAESTIGPEVDEELGEPVVGYDEEGEPIVNYEQIKEEQVDYTPITLNAGESIDFNVITKGQPNTYLWELPGSDKEMLEPEEVGEKFVRAGYYREGTYDVTFIAARFGPDGADTLVLKDFVTVLPSVGAAGLRGLSMSEDEKLVLSFSAVLETPPADIANEFMVIRNGFNTKITSCKLNPVNPTQIVIEIEDNVWNGDDILLNFTGNKLMTTEGYTVNGVIKNVDAVTEYEVEYQPYIEDLVMNGGFERIDITTMAPYQDGAPYSDQFFEISEDYAYKGRRSLKISGIPGKTGLAAQSVLAYDLQLIAGKSYKFEYSVKTECQFYEYGHVVLPIRSSMTGTATEINIGKHIWLSAAEDWLHQEGVWEQKTSYGDATAYLKFPAICYLPTADPSVAGKSFTYYLDDVKFYEYHRHGDPDLPTGGGITAPELGVGSGL